MSSGNGAAAPGGVKGVAVVQSGSSSIASVFSVKFSPMITLTRFAPPLSRPGCALTGPTRVSVI
ncbi:MAG TPA: hypothetical protein VGH48_16315 [Caldimonas sp.]